MGITYLIGNGFDISIGLKTQYKDFYKYMIKNSLDNQNSENEILKQIKGNIEQWSNLEKKLGDYTECIGNDEEKLEKFYDDKFDIDIKLRKYLKTQEDRIDWTHENTSDNVSSNFRKYFYGFYELFKPAEKDEIIKVINSKGLSEYKIISFNYTNVIDKCNELLANGVELLYLHGSLKKDNAILGVNDSSQINNKFFRESNEMSISMCKLEINKDIGEYATSKAESMLNQGNIVCIYGMSIGETDKYWWDKIVTNLINGRTDMIIIFQYNTKLDMRHRVSVLRAKENVIEQLLECYSGEINDKESLKRQIKVLFNSNMFKLDVVFKEDSEVEELIASTKTN